MKCPNCNYEPIEFDDCINEDHFDNDRMFLHWTTLCPNCGKEYIVCELWECMKQEVTKEIQNDE